MDNNEKIAQNFIKEEFSKAKILLIKKGQKSTIIQYVIETKAWNDTIIREKYIKDSPVLGRKQKICDYVTDQIKNLVKEKRDFRDWHNETIKGLKTNYQMDCGLAQKLVNMSIKYFYFIELGYAFLPFEGKISEYQAEFDIPVDSYILKWILYNSLLDKIIFEKKKDLSVWTKMADIKIYDILQERAKCLMREIYPGEPLLIAETKVWSKIKSLKEIM